MFNIKENRDLPWWLSGKVSAKPAEMVWIIAYGTTKPKPHSHGAHAPQGLKPARPRAHALQRETTAVRSRRTAARAVPAPCKERKAPAATKTQHSQKIKLLKLLKKKRKKKKKAV